MIGTKNEIEAVARAFYDLQDCARGWNQEPARLKERFLSNARAAIAALDEPPVMLRSSLVAERSGDAQEGCEFLLDDDTASFLAHANSPCKDRRVTGVPSMDEAFRACSGASLTAATLVARSWEQISRSRALIAQSLALLQSQHIPKRCYQS